MEPPVLILTACVNPRGTTTDTPAERLEMYLRNARLWLEKTSLKVILVDSSGYAFRELGAHPNLLGVVDVTMLDLGPRSNSSSVYEALSLLAVLSSPLSQGHGKFVKVTARYYLPGLEAALAAVPPSANFVCQCLFGSDYRHSEVFGFDRRVFAEVFKRVLFDDKIMEQGIFEIDKVVSDCVVACLPQLHIQDPVRRGGDGLVLPHL